MARTYSNRTTDPKGSVSKSFLGNVQRLFRRNISGWLLIIPSVLLFIIIVWRPIIIGIFYSFFRLEGFNRVEFVGFKNFVDVLSDTNFLQTLGNTVKYVLWSFVIGFSLPFIAAVCLNEMVRGKGYFKFIMYMPTILPIIATSLIWQFIYSDSSGGLLNIIRSFFGLEATGWLSNKVLTIPLIVVSMTWNSFGSTMIMYLASLQSIDQSLYEAARLDGAGFWRRIRVVLFPHMRGIVLLLAVRQIIGVFQVAEQPLVMTGGGPNGASLSLGLTNYFYAFQYGNLEKSMALGVITFLLLISLTFLYFRLDRKIND